MVSKRVVFLVFLACIASGCTKKNQAIQSGQCGCKIEHFVEGDRELITYPMRSWVELKKSEPVTKSSEQAWGGVQIKP